MQKLNAYFSPDGRCKMRRCHQYALTCTWRAHSNFSAWSGGQMPLHLGRGNRRARTSCKYAASMQSSSHLCAGTLPLSCLYPATLYVSMQSLCNCLYLAMEPPVFSHRVTCVHSAATLHISCLYPASLYTQLVMSAYLRTYICDTCDLKALASRQAATLMLSKRQRHACAAARRCVSIRQHTSAFVSIRRCQHTLAYMRGGEELFKL
jgi:hypothetical protein